MSTRVLGVIGAALAALLVALLLLTAGPGGPSLVVVSGSENKTLEPIVMDWARAQNATVEMRYLGSVDIARELEQGAGTEADAVWPANSLWIELGDTGRVVTHNASILRSPVVLGVRKSIAGRLGWIGRDDITIQEISQAAQSGAFRLAMTSATQSNSGASAYLGFLYALAGNPDVLTLQTLADPELQAGVRQLLAQVDRSSGSSGWLGEALVANPGAYDAMFNYESVVLETNSALAAAGQEPLYLIYPANGLAVADSPLAFVSKGDPAKEKAFLDLQAHLLSEPVQRDLLAAGRRTGLLGMAPEAHPSALWNADWGADAARAIAPVPTPSAEVIREALRLYQSELRKPSLTVWVLDISGSMGGDPIDQLKQAMHLLLDPYAAELNLLQPSSRDITIVLPFNHQVLPAFEVKGNDAGALAGADGRVQALEAGGGTDLYAALSRALDLIAPYAKNGSLGNYLPAIVAMTDGASDAGHREALLQRLAILPWAASVPIHAVAFGNADDAQLEELNRASIGRLFTAGDDLAGALRQAKGYN